MFKRVLVACDLTEQSTTAIGLTRQLAIETGASVVAVHIVDMPNTLRPFAGPSFRTDLASYRAVVARQLATAEDRLRTQLEQAAIRMTDTRIIVRAGTPAPLVAAIAEEVGADLIVVGRGRDGRLGPVAEHTVRLVGRTVMVAPVYKKPRAKRPLPASYGRRPGGRPGRPRA
ncbi:MAG: universal stress protein [Kofleriaceae bacterium]